MDEPRALLERLERIEALDRSGAPPAELLDELRGLVGEVERQASRSVREAGPAPTELRCTGHEGSAAGPPLG